MEPNTEPRLYVPIRMKKSTWFILHEMLIDADADLVMIYENSQGNYVGLFDKEDESEFLTAKIRKTLIPYLGEEMHIMLEHWKALKIQPHDQDEYDFAGELVIHMETLIDEFHSNLYNGERTEDDW
jgi:hypothetical protein